MYETERGLEGTKVNITTVLLWNNDLCVDSVTQITINSVVVVLRRKVQKHDSPFMKSRPNPVFYHLSLLCLGEKKQQHLADKLPPIHLFS